MYLKCEIFKRLDKKKDKNILLNNLLNVKDFTISNHFKILNRILKGN